MSAFCKVFAFYCSFVAAYTESVTELMTNSTVDEYILSNTNNRKVECNNQFVCDLKCNDSKDITFITNSISVRIECTQCDYFKVYAEHANNINIRFSNAQYAYFHLEHALNINMTLLNTYYSVIYAQHAQTFRLQRLFITRYNIFYLDYVSNEIHFECTDIEYECHPGETMISAAFANFFKWQTPFERRLYDVENHIFCPSHADDVCVIDSWLIEYSNIYISNVSHNVRPLNVTTSSNPSHVWRDFDLWCNNNQNGFYQSFTEIYTEFINDNTTQQICTDIASPCCYLNDIDNNNSNDIFCDDPDTLCMIECTQNGTDCSSNSIYSSDSTIDLNVICIEPYSCYQTTIYCPSSIQSLCSVSCLDSKSCGVVIIKYNTNNEYMTLECLSGVSCYHLKAYIDRSDNDHSAEIHNVANITCVGCLSVDIYVNTEMDALNIICYDCGYSKIYAKMVQKLRINCTMYHGCNYIDIYGKTNEKNTVQLSCDSSGSCWGVNIINGFEYELDYISVIGPYRNESLLDLNIYCSSVDTEFGILWANTNTYNIHVFYSSGSTIYSSGTTSASRSAYMCDPFSDHWNGIYECNAGESCDYDFYDAEYILIYANNAKSISISCRSCRYFNINAQNASSVSLSCTKYCSFSNVNADNVDTFSLECGSCSYLIISAMHSRNVIIDATKMYRSEINAIYNTNAFTFRCRSSCTVLDLLIPSNPSSKTSIKCDGDDVCNGINIHSNNGSWNDITDLTIISCDDTAGEYTPDNHNWVLFCPSSSHAGHSVDDGLYSRYGNVCKYILSLQTTFCHCDRFDHQQLTEYLSGGTIMFDQFATECFELEMGQHNIRSLISLQSFVVGIVSLCAIFFWCIIAIKNVLFRFFRPAKYYEITNIEPPSLYLLRYIYCSDLFVWCAQIYILIVCWVIYEYSKGVCESLPSTSDEEIIYRYRCNLRWFCVVQNDVCGVDPSILFFYMVSLVSLCITIISLFFADEYLQSHCVHYRCCGHHSRQWNDIIQNEYLQRTFWPYSTPIWIYIFIRYCVFFSSVFLMFYFTYDEDDINFNIRIQWYDIFPVLLLVITNEGLKQRYRMLPSYDMGTHLLHILSEHYGKHIASIIVSFVGENVLPEVQMVDITISMDIEIKERTKLNHDQSEQ